MCIGRKPITAGRAIRGTSKDTRATRAGAISSSRSIIEPTLRRRDGPAQHHDRAGSAGQPGILPTISEAA